MNGLKLGYCLLLLMYLQRAESETKTICQSDTNNHLIVCVPEKYIKIKEAFYGSRGDQNNCTSSRSGTCDSKVVSAAVTEKCNCTSLRNVTKQQCIINMQDLKGYGNGSCLGSENYLQVIYDCVDQIECGSGVSVPDVSTAFPENGTVTPRNLSKINFASSTTTAFDNRTTTKSWLVVVVVVLIIIVALAMIGLYWIACRKKQCIPQCSSNTKATTSMTCSFAKDMQETATEGTQNIQSQTATYETITKNEQFVVENQLYASQTAAIRNNRIENTDYDSINSSCNPVNTENEGTSRSQYSKLNAGTKENKIDVNHKQMEYNELYDVEETGEQIDPSSIYNEILEPRDHENTPDSYYQTVTDECMV